MQNTKTMTTECCVWGKCWSGFRSVNCVNCIDAYRIHVLHTMYYRPSILIQTHKQSARIYWFACPFHIILNHWPVACQSANRYKIYIFSALQCPTLHIGVRRTWVNSIESFECICMLSYSLYFITAHTHYFMLIYGNSLWPGPAIAPAANCSCRYTLHTRQPTTQHCVIILMFQWRITIIIKHPLLILNDYE